MMTIKLEVEAGIFSEPRSGWLVLNTYGEVSRFIQDRDTFTRICGAITVPTTVHVSKQEFMRWVSWQKSYDDHTKLCQKE